jgi:hypothetical protein
MVVWQRVQRGRWPSRSRAGRSPAWGVWQEVQRPSPNGACTTFSFSSFSRPSWHSWQSAGCFLGRSKGRPEVAAAWQAEQSPATGWAVGRSRLAVGAWTLWQSPQRAFSTG